MTLFTSKEHMCRAALESTAFQAVDIMEDPYRLRLAFGVVRLQGLGFYQGLGFRDEASEFRV